MTKQRPIMTICSSAAFYRQAVDIAQELETLGYHAVLPISAERMRDSGNFDYMSQRTWLTNPEDYPKKAAFIRLHLDKVAAGDAVLVLNFEKDGRPNYIGGNVLMEMAVGFHFKKSLFIFNDFPEESAYLEEIRGLLPTALHGDLRALPRPEQPTA